MRVVTIGGATVDIIVRGAPALGNPGAKRDVDHVGLYIGGGAVNAALGFAAAGASVRILCAIGDDTEGELLREALARKGIDVAAIEIIPRAPTGKAVIHIGIDGEASVYAQRGASTRLSMADASAHVHNTDVLYVSALAECATTELAQLLSGTGQRNFKLALNPGARQLAAGCSSLASLLAKADLVCLNAVEAQLLARVPSKALSTTLPVDHARKLVRNIAQHPEQCVLVTLGATGALFLQGETIHECPAGQGEIVSTLGAGDAFASSFVFHWASGCSPHDALSSATRRAGSILEVAPANLAGPLTR